MKWWFIYPWALPNLEGYARTKLARLVAWRPLFDAGLNRNNTKVVNELPFLLVSTNFRFCSCLRGPRGNPSERQQLFHKAQYTLPERHPHQDHSTVCRLHVYTAHSYYIPLSTTAPSAQHLHP